MRNLFIVLSLLAIDPAFTDDNLRLISVTGLVEKSYKPNIVHLSLNVWGKGDSAKVAQTNHQVHYEVLKKSLERFSVKTDRVQTTFFNLYPETVYEPVTYKNRVVGYQAQQGLSVTLEKIEDAGPFIDSLTNSSKALNGGVTVASIGFDIAERAAEEKILLGEAVRAAEAKALILATAARVKLKGVFKLSPRSANLPVRMQETSALLASGAREKGASTEFSSGDVKILGEVSADYMIE